MSRNISPDFLSRRIDLNLPKIELNFTENPIIFRDVRSKDPSPKKVGGQAKLLLSKRSASDRTLGDINERETGSRSNFSQIIVRDYNVCPTIISSSQMYRSIDSGFLSDYDLCVCSSFPLDYDFCGLPVKYIVGMSVPPIMMAQVSNQVYLQWLSKLPIK